MKENSLQVKIDGEWFNVQSVQLDNDCMVWMNGVEDARVNSSEKPSILKPRYSQEQLEEAFKLVQPKNNWKNPINAVVPNTVDVDLISAAISHFTGGPSDFIPIKGDKFRVTSPGYYVCIGA